MKRLSLRTKLMRVVIVSTAFSLLFIAVSVQFIETNLARERIVEDLEVVADILGNRSVAPLVFSDSSAASDNLMAARFNPDIDKLCLYEGSGELFSTYYREGMQGQSCATKIDQENLHLQAEIDGRHVELDLELIFDNELTGYLSVQGNLDATYSGRWFLYGLLATTLLISLLLSHLLATQLRPCALAWYKAISAFRNKSWGLSASIGN
jgi:hypothetical protein